MTDGKGPVKKKDVSKVIHIQMDDGSEEEEVDSDQELLDDLERKKSENVTDEAGDDLTTSSPETQAFMSKEKSFSSSTSEKRLDYKVSEPFAKGDATNSKAETFESQSIDEKKIINANSKEEGSSANSPRISDSQKALEVDGNNGETNVGSSSTDKIESEKSEKLESDQAKSIPSIQQKPRQQQFVDSSYQSVKQVYQVDQHAPLKAAMEQAVREYTRDEVKYAKKRSRDEMKTEQQKTDKYVKPNSGGTDQSEIHKNGENVEKGDLGEIENDSLNILPKMINQYSVTTSVDGNRTVHLGVIDMAHLYKWLQGHRRPNLTPSQYRTMVRLAVERNHGKHIEPDVHAALSRRIASLGKKSWGFQIEIKKQREEFVEARRNFVQQPTRSASGGRNNGDNSSPPSLHANILSKMDKASAQGEPASSRFVRMKSDADDRQSTMLQNNESMFRKGVGAPEQAMKGDVSSDTDRSPMGHPQKPLLQNSPSMLQTVAQKKAQARALAAMQQVDPQGVIPEALQVRLLQNQARQREHEINVERIMMDLQLEREALVHEHAEINVQIHTYLLERSKKQQFQKQQQLEQHDMYQQELMHQQYAQMLQQEQYMRTKNMMLMQQQQQQQQQQGSGASLESPMHHMNLPNSHSQHDANSPSMDSMLVQNMLRRQSLQRPYQ